MSGKSRTEERRLTVKKYWGWQKNTGRCKKVPEHKENTEDIKINPQTEKNKHWNTQIMTLSSGCIWKGMQPCMKDCWTFHQKEQQCTIPLDLTKKCEYKPPKSENNGSFAPVIANGCLYFTIDGLLGAPSPVSTYRFDFVSDSLSVYTMLYLRTFGKIANPFFFIESIGWSSMADIGGAL